MIHTGDCLEVLRTLPDSSVDAVVTDPPYGLAFMGKRWDYDVPGVEVWAECLRVLKPGGHLLAFAGTRTQHRMAVRIEDAGFEIRDMIAWVYGSGFPKSLDVSKAIDKAAGAEREVVGTYHGATNIGKKSDGKRGYGCDGQDTGGTDTTVYQTAPATDAARQWSGWGTALKPSHEPITLARKPLIGTVAANVLEHGTGALNVDGCRVETDDDMSRPECNGRHMEDRPWVKRRIEQGLPSRPATPDKGLGRFPANLIHDGSDEVADLLGNAARFFYCAKASANERDAGLTIEPKAGIRSNAERSSEAEKTKARINNHPTVKPVALMRYLVRLVTPPGCVVLDPFMGSGTTGVACALEGMQFVGIEQDPAYVEIAQQRIAAAANGGTG